MHFRPPFLVVLALVVTLCGGCRSEAAPTATLAAAPAPKGAAPGRPDLCHVRARCAVTTRQVVTGLTETSLVEVRIAHAPDASADEDRCDRREYWVSRPTGDVLVAVDCETQWGADNAGPAEVKLRGAQLDVRYVEFQSSDRCESYAATVALAGPKLTAVQSRTVGNVKKNACNLGKGLAPVDPLGDGSAAHPLLTLHR